MAVSRVSVIIPTFNRAHTLPRALDSVLGQTLRTDTIIVIDDGSTDETTQIVSEHYPDLTYIRQKNRGVSTARNKGIMMTDSDWVTFLDSDDEWLPEKLERQMTALEQQPEMKICHTDEIWIRNGKRVNPMKKHAKSGGWIFQKCLPLCCVSPSSVMIHRSLFDDVGLFDESLSVCEDYDLWLRIAARYSFLYLSEKLTVKYGGHEDQLSRKHWGMDRFRIRALEKILASKVLSNSDRKAAEAMLAKKTRIISQGALKRGKIWPSEKVSI